MNIVICMVSFLVIGTKFLDCYTTSTKINSLSEERNPIARKLMKRFGIHKTIWLIFAISILIVGLSNFLLFTFYKTIVYKILYISLGTFIAMTQFAVALTNKTKKLNIFTKLLLKKYS